MSDPDDDISPPDDKARAASTPDRLDELRSLLIGPERAQIVEIRDQLEERVLDPQTLSRILPDAIVLRGRQDQVLSKALRPSVEEAITASIQRRPQTLANALFPVIGPAIRKAVASAFREMIQSLNQVLDKTVSLNGLKWRLEAWRTGKPFAEIVLLHTLEYRVEQVFLIHRETGLLLQHVAVPSVDLEDSEMVSGMLTAIRDFFHDSFDVGEESDGDSEVLRVGDLTVRVEQGPWAYLAAVIRGNPAPEVHRAMEDTIETVHLEQGHLLEAFQGDAAPFKESAPHLEACLKAQYSRRSVRPSAAVWVAAAAILAALGLWAFHALRADSRWTAYVQSLKDQPGIVVLEAKQNGRDYSLSGLRDPLAADPAALLAEAGIDPTRVRETWEPYFALDPPFILARVKAALAPPASVTLTLSEGVVRASGRAPQRWVEEASRLARAVPGVEGFHYEGSPATEASSPDREARERRLRDLAATVERRVILFDPSSASARGPEQAKLEGLARLLSDLEKAAGESGRALRVRITGHTDALGAEPKNMTLSRERAEGVRDFLTARGVDPAILEPVGLGSTAPLLHEATDEDRAGNRSVRFSVELSGAAEPGAKPW